MKRPRSPFFTVLTIVIAPAVVALAVTLLVLNIVDARKEPSTILLPTLSGTALIPPRGGVAEAATGGDGGETGADIPIGDESGGEAAPSACENPLHIVAAGETLGHIAEQYGLSLDEVTQMNQMLNPAFDPNFLSIGQQITVPTCGVPMPTPTATPTITPVPTRVVPTPGPTATEQPGRAIVKVARVLNPGDVTSEAVEIINEGTSVARLGGWQLLNPRTGEVFVFPPLNLFPQGAVTVYSGVGENTAIDIYWGRDEAAWQPGDTLQLLDPQQVIRDEIEVEER